MTWGCLSRRDCVEWNFMWLVLAPKKDMTFSLQPFNFGTFRTRLYYSTYFKYFDSLFFLFTVFANDAMAWYCISRFFPVVFWLVTNLSRKVNLFCFDCFERILVFYSPVMLIVVLSWDFWGLLSCYYFAFVECP